VQQVVHRAERADAPELLLEDPAEVLAPERGDAVGGGRPGLDAGAEALLLVGVEGRLGPRPAASAEPGRPAALYRAIQVCTDRRLYPVRSATVGASRPARANRTARRRLARVACFSRPIIRSNSASVW
jgi:hypothetical protein